MARANPHRPFIPDENQMKLVPAISGNAINGQGEKARRRARAVYWAVDPDDIAHGRMQRWFYSAKPNEEDVVAAREERAALLAEDIPAVSGEAVIRDGAAWLGALRDYADTLPCERIGVTAFNPDWLYEGVTADWKKVIVIAVQHDYESIAAAPKPLAGAEVVRQYGRAAFSAKRVAGWLRKQGWAADPVTGPMTGEILLIPPAIECGFGELGKHGSIIDPEFGSSFRLSAVLTDAPIAGTPRLEHGIDDFCANCRICEDACPPHAIVADKQMVRGETKWYVDFDKCLPFFNEHHGCAICIAVCPWSRPGVGPNLVEKLARRRARLSSGED